MMAVPWLRRLVAGLSPRRLGFDPGSVHVGFVVHKVALGRFSPSTRFFPVNFIPLVLHYKEKRKREEMIKIKRKEKIMNETIFLSSIISATILNCVLRQG
jgi:hypothetical protein